MTGAKMAEIQGGQFWLGRLSEDEIRGEAFAELRELVTLWKGPPVSWPQGTEFTAPRKERQWSSTTSWAIVPSGVRYELLVGDLREGEPDPREVPPVIWDITVSPVGDVFAHSRIAQMKVTLDPPYPVDDERLRDAYAGVPLGLVRRPYHVGRLSQGLRQETRVVSEGWRFGESPT
jgi:hypothetical protein